MTPPQTTSDLHIDSSETMERDGFVFISYKNEEAAFAERIRTVLKKAGFSVWWDRQIQCGQEWNDILDDAVKQASCVVVLWSSLSAESRWVLHEASVALARDNYAPARIQLCSIPAPYNQLQATDIIDWDGVSEHPGVRNLLERCNGLMPKRKSRWSHGVEALWTRRRSAPALLFGVVALFILVWQTGASRSQLRQLDALVSQQTDSSKSLGELQKQSENGVSAQLQQISKLDELVLQQIESSKELDRIVSQQTESSMRFDQFQQQSASNVRSQLAQLNALVSQQTEAQAKLDEFKRQAERNIMRGYYHLEPLTIEFTLEYPLTGKFASYAARLRRQFDFRRYKGVLINLQSPDFKDLLPGLGEGEEYAKRELLSDETVFRFVDPKQAVDPNSRSFVRRGELARGTIQLNSMPQFLADIVVKLPSSGKVKQDIELSLSPGAEKFVKKVRCENPVRTGDDVFAFSVVDLIGRVMSYEAGDDAQLADFRFIFSFDYDSYSYLNSTITFPNGVKEVEITPKHVGLQKYEVDETVLAARERFDQLPLSQKSALLNVEIKHRLDFFVKTFMRMETSKDWSLARWAKVEWTADALDGKPPFVERAFTDPAFEGRSFKWLLAELSRLTKGADRNIAAAVEGANKLFDLLTGVGPETSNDQINEALKQVRERVFTDFGLGPWKPDTSF